MTFLQALNWMNESEDNVAFNDNGTPFKIVCGILMIRVDSGHWEKAILQFDYLSDLKWQKSEPTLEAVEVVAYMDTQDGEIRLMLPGSKYENEELASIGDKVNKHWRKVRVRFENNPSGEVGV